MRHERSFGARSHMYIGEGVSSRKFERRKPASRWKWYAGGMFIALVALILGMRSSYILITAVRVEGVSVERPKDVRDVVRKTLDGNYLGIIPRANVLVYPKESVLASLAMAFPRFTEIHVEREGTNGLFVDVKERESAYVACVAQNDCYYVDEAGTMFAPAPLFSGNLYFEFFPRIATTTASSTSVLGTKVFQETEWSRTIDLKNRLTDMFASSTFASSTLVRMFEREDGIREIEIADVARPLENWRIRYREDQDVSQIVNNAQESLSYLADEMKSTKKAKLIEYVDMRFGNKVVYKYKE